MVFTKMNIFLADNFKFSIITVSSKLKFKKILFFYKKLNDFSKVKIKF